MTPETQDREWRRKERVLAPETPDRAAKTGMEEVIRRTGITVQAGTEDRTRKAENLGECRIYSFP